MGEKLSIRVLFPLLFAILFLHLFSLNFGTVKSEENTSYPNIRVNRVVQIDDGTLLINDSLTLSANASQNVRSLDSFQIGFPASYKKELAYFFAYDMSGRLQATLDVSSNGIEFCWINVSFPESINVSDGGSYNFTVIYVFSEKVKAEGSSLFSADFPLYPSLVEEANFCSIMVMLPLGANLISSSPVFSSKTIDSRQVLSNETGTLEAFANISSWVKFTVTAQEFLLLEIDDMRREIKIDGWGGLSVTDFYQITNKAKKNVPEISLVLPSNADEISVQDVYGTYKSGVTVKEREKYTELKVSLREALKTDEKVKLLIVYRLSFWKYIVRSDWQDYALNTNLVRPEGWIIKRFVITVSLPEGAQFQSSTRTPSHVEKEVFLETVKFYDYNVTKFHELDFNLKYRYLILWVSFRPTIWIGTVMAMVGAVFFLRRAHKPAIIVTMPLSPEVFRKFVNTYEERRKIALEVGSLEQRVQRGKISRRQYRLRRSSLDGRLSKLQKDLVELRKEIEAIGGHYAEMMKRLEIAETEIETLNGDIERVEVRYRRGELSAEARRRLLNEYNRRKEQAENTIAETLLRLREEIR